MYDHFKHSFIMLTLSIKYFDQHLNLILSDVEETHTLIDFNETTLEEIHKVTPFYLLMTHKIY